MLAALDGAFQCSGETVLVEMTNCHCCCSGSGTAPASGGGRGRLDGEQIKSLVERLRSRAMYPRAITALFTRVRRGELLALRWRDVELDGKEPSLRVREAVEETKAGLRLKTPKTENSVREISLPDIVEALREHRRQQREQRVALGLGKLDDSALLFPRLNGEPQSPRAFSKEWADVAASIGLPVTFHALRHTHART